MINIRHRIKNIFICFSLVITILIGLIKPFAKVITFSDVPKDYWAYTQIMDIANKGLIVGTTSIKDGVGTFEPNKNMRQCEFITIISRLLYYNEINNYSAKITNWYDSAYYTCINNKLFTSDEFPYSTLNNFMSREEMAMILARVDKKLNGESSITITSSSIPDYNSIDTKYRNDVLYSYSRKLLCGINSSGTFSPKGVLTRAQAATVIYRLLQDKSTLPSNNTPSNNDINSTNIDVTNVNDGFIKVCAKSDKKIKVKVIVNEKEYVYTIPNNGDYYKLPLSEGNQSYEIKIFENISGTKYKTIMQKTIKTNMKSTFAPFLTSNFYVNYSQLTSSVKKADELVKDCNTTIEKINAIYNYIVENFKYDTEKAKNISSDYIPNIDEIMNKKSGICYDYAVVMASMLRSQNIPCRVVFGYTKNAYHAWVDVYSQESGWMNSYIYFDKQSWKLLDPTFVSSSHGSQSIIKYVTNDDNYLPKFYY